MKATDEPYVVVPARIEREQHEKLEAIAARDDRTVSWLVRQAVTRYLEVPPRDPSGGVRRYLPAACPHLR